MLTLIQVLEKLKTTPNHKGKESAVRQQERVSLHGKPILQKRAGVSSPAFTEMVDWYCLSLPKDKRRAVKRLIRHPLDTVTISGEIYQQLERAFEGVDREEKYVFGSSELEADWHAYKDNVLGGQDSWRSRGMDGLRCRHNSVAIVDMSADVNEPGTLAAPYWYLRDLNTIFEHPMVSPTEFEYLILRDQVTGENYQRITVLDDEAYSVYHYFSDTQTLTEEIRNEHQLGYCPATMFWTDCLDSETPIVKDHPFSAFLGKFDWCQGSHWTKRMGDLINGWPITTTFKQSCTYRSEKEYCDAGFLRSTAEGHENVYLLGSDLEIAECPSCAHNNSVGPGTNYQVPLPNNANGNTVMLPAVGITNVDVAGLKYNAETLKDQEVALFSGIVGSVFEAMNNQAVNEKQVQSLFEARRKALVGVARNFERLQTWIESTMCRLRYGAAFIETSINYGTEFFLFSAGELLTMYTEQRDLGADAAVLDQLQNLYYQTRYRRQPSELERVRIMLAIDPARHHNPASLPALKADGIISREEYALKANMSTLINRFERDHGPLVAYADTTPWGSRIDRITAVLLAYIPPAPTVNTPGLLPGEESNNPQRGQQPVA